MDVWTCTAHFQSTLCTWVYKNLCNHTYARTQAQVHTICLLSRVITPTSPDFLLKLIKNPIQSSFIHFGQIWSNLMKKEIVIFIHMVQSTMYSTELHISSKSNSFVLFVKLSTAENSGFFNQHTELRSHCCQQFSCIIWSCFDTKTADNCGILT